jgi:hypothetical protein
VRQIFFIFFLTLSFSVFSQCKDNSECGGGGVCNNGACMNSENVPAPPSAAVPPSSALPQAAFGQMAVSSDPQGAHIYLDSVNTGKITPAVFDSLVGGKHVVRISAKDFLDEFDSIDVTAGSIDTLAVKLKAFPAITVATEPADAMIAINGTEIGKTPYAVTALAPGEYIIRLGKETYADSSVSVVLLADQKASLSILLRHSDQSIVKKRKKMVVGWTIRAIAGAAAIATGIGGVIYNNTASRRYDEYSAIKVVGDHSDAFFKVKSAQSTRNVFYGLSGAMLGIFGISFAF